jgi:hypothetical protein
MRQSSIIGHFEVFDVRAVQSRPVTTLATPAPSLRPINGMREAARTGRPQAPGGRVRQSPTMFVTLPRLPDTAALFACERLGRPVRAASRIPPDRNAVSVAASVAPVPATPDATGRRVHLVL